MMLGCCHCGSESTPSVPSESSVFVDNTNNCAVCVVAPRRFRATVTTPNGTGAVSPCCSSYRGAFILTHVGDSSCLWESDEYALYSKVSCFSNTTFACTEPNVRKRISLSITGSLSYSITIRHYTSNGGSPSSPLLVPWTYSKSFTSSDCFADRRIPYTSHTTSTNSDTLGTGNCPLVFLCGHVFPVLGTAFYVDLEAL